MVVGDTAVPPLNIPPPQIEPLSDDDGSSPLSDAPPDRDGVSDGLPDHVSVENEDRDIPQSSDDELSDANDTEAETERLYDTPQNPTRQKDVVLSDQAEGQVYERTPSKLRHHNTANTHEDDDDDDPLSDADISMASSPPAQDAEPPAKLPSPPLDLLADLAELANQEAESRKRKRSSIPAEIDVGEPLRKRTGSVQTPNRATRDQETTAPKEDEDAEPSAHTRSGEHSADEAPNSVVPDEEPEHPRETKTRKHTRSGSRRIKEQEAAAAAATDGHDSRDDTHDGAGPDEEGGHTGDDEPLVDEADEEAEAAHRNEEECKLHATQKFPPFAN